MRGKAESRTPRDIRGAKPTKAAMVVTLHMGNSQYLVTQRAKSWLRYKQNGQKWKKQGKKQNKQ